MKKLFYGLSLGLVLTTAAFAGSCGQEGCAEEEKVIIEERCAFCLACAPSENLPVCPEVEGKEPSTAPSDLDGSCVVVPA